MHLLIYQTLPKPRIFLLANPLILLYGVLDKVENERHSETHWRSDYKEIIRFYKDTQRKGKRHWTFDWSFEDKNSSFNDYSTFCLKYF